MTEPKRLVDETTSGAELRALEAGRTEKSPPGAARRAIERLREQSQTVAVAEPLNRTAPLRTGWLKITQHKGVAYAGWGVAAASTAVAVWVVLHPPAEEQPPAGAALDFASELGPESNPSCRRWPYLIDDFEDGDGRRCPSAGGGGTWFTFRDQGSVLPAPNETGVLFRPELLREPRAASRYAAHVEGAGHHESAGFGVVLNHQSPCDLSGFVGFRFWARGYVDGALRVFVTSTDTMPPRLGGTCDARCYDHHHVTIALGDEWRQYEVRFEDLRQVGWGTLARFAADRALTIEFSPPNGGSPYDIWVDDPEWIPQSAKQP